MAATHEMHNKSHSKQMLYLQLVKSKFNNGRNHSDMFLDIGVSTKHCTKKKFSVDFTFCAVKEVKSL